MAINFAEQANPTATNMDKGVHVKVVKLTFADFTTGPAASIKAVLPADSTILLMNSWKKTDFSGGSVSAVTLSIGVTGAATQFVNAVDVLTPVTGTSAELTPIAAIMQPLSLSLGADISLLFTGTATTGNPTAGEMYVSIYYVR